MFNVVKFRRSEYYYQLMSSVSWSGVGVLASAAERAGAQRTAGVHQRRRQVDVV